MKIGSLTKPFTPWQLHKLQKEHDRNYYYADGYMVERVKMPRQKLAVVSSVPHCVRLRRTQKRRGADGKKQATSGNSPEPEPERPLLTTQLLDQATLADFLCSSKKTVQNLYSKTPWLLPPAISIPGARGPRWTPEAVQEWLQNRPQHTHKPFPSAPKRKAGRPRIALVSGGAK